MLPYPYKDREWHKEKKHRHRRPLSLLLKGLPVTSQSHSAPYPSKRRANTACCCGALLLLVPHRHESVTVALPTMWAPSRELLSVRKIA